MPLPSAGAKIRPICFHSRLHSLLGHEKERDRVNQESKRKALCVDSGLVITLNYTDSEILEAEFHVALINFRRPLDSANPNPGSGLRSQSLLKNWSSFWFNKNRSKNDLCLPKYFFIKQKLFTISTVFNPSYTTYLKITCIHSFDSLLFFHALPSLHGCLFEGHAQC